MNVYKTTDFKTAVYLMWAGFNVVRTERANNSRTVRFVFDDTERLHQARMDFVNDDSNNEGIRMLRCIDKAKTLIHQ